ncbi:SdpI family protein [Massilia sp. UMI-21]|nr:SdpI family protein [Massilia sp. UMI-21]
MKKRFILVCLAALLLVAGMIAFVYPELPARVPLHWNAAGQADGWGARHLLLIYLALLAATSLLWLVLPLLSPRRFAVDSFEATWWFTGMAMVCLLAYVQCVHLWAAWKPGLPMERAVLGGIGLFFVLIGNVMGKVRRNFWLGVRTPWTLANERVWYATHRLAARTMVAGGLLTLAAALSGLPGQVAVAALIVAALVPVVFSLVYYKRLERAGTLEA